VAGGSGARAPYAQALLLHRPSIMSAVGCFSVVICTAQLLASTINVSRTLSLRRGRAKKASVCSDRVCEAAERLRMYMPLLAGEL